MLDLKLLRKDKEGVAAKLARRGGDIDLSSLIEVYEKHLSNQSTLEALQREMNEASQEIGKLVRDKKDTAEAKEALKGLKEDIKESEEDFRLLEEAFNALLLEIPNIPDDTVPDGKSEEDNVEIRKWGEPKSFGFTPKSHVEIGESLGILDFKRAAKISGARFSLYRGAGARLERALIGFMLNTHTANGYEEIIPPFMVSAKSMTGTGQLPKFEEDLFKVEGADYYLIPTAEVPLTNIYSDEILGADDLPKKFCAYTPCFRSEAGSYGKIATGLIRQHQFNKVEVVKLVKPEDSMAELETLTADAESILQMLELPYRVVQLCTGDLGFSATKTYDIEIWLPSQERYVEISSCSNFADFQARRMSIRFKRDQKAKPEFVHTLNGSGLAVGRTFVAILENYQNEDGTVEIPKALKHYMGDVKVLGK
jgi:seryl-tRNA synthetase